MQVVVPVQEGGSESSPRPSLLPVVCTLLFTAGRLRLLLEWNGWLSFDTLHPLPVPPTGLPLPVFSRETYKL